MLTRVIRRLRTRWADDGGQALLFVLIAVTLLASIPLAIATTTVDELPQTTRNLNYEAAYEAAQAGLNDYLQNLDSNSTYGIYTRTKNPGGNPALSGWVQASTSPPEYYSYAPADSSGELVLTVSGKAGTGSGTVVRTFQYNVDPASTLDDVYWSNYETKDPSIFSGTPASCATHYGQANGTGGTGPPTGNTCEVDFANGDELNGPVFSDDTFRMCDNPGAKFDSSVQSGNIYNTATAGTNGVNSVWITGTSCSGGTAVPTFAVTPQKVGNEIPQQSEQDLTPALDYGCFITGGSGTNLTPTTTTITLSVTGTAPNQTTKVVWSGGSVDNDPSNANSCASGFSVSSLSAGLIFVNGNVNISGTMTGGLDIVTCSTSNVTGGLCNGSSSSNITVTNNLLYPAANKTMVSGDPTADLSDSLGLIAQNSVIVADVSNIEIDAAILALSDSFYVNNYSGAGTLGTLNVFGSIAQNFRGPVATSSNGNIVSGYSKNYNYDNSLQTLFPPFFLPPQDAVWGPTSYEECGTGLSKSVMNTTSNGC
jgi:hypothetical protein